MKSTVLQGQITNRMSLPQVQRKVGHLARSARTDPGGVKDISRWLSASDTTGIGSHLPSSTLEGSQKRARTCALCDPFRVEIILPIFPVVSETRPPANICDPCGSITQLLRPDYWIISHGNSARTFACASGLCDRYFKNSISRYVGSGQYSSETMVSSLSHSVRRLVIAGSTLSRMYLACSCTAPFE